MRAALVFWLLFKLSHGLNNDSFSNDPQEMFSDIVLNWAHPCQRSQNNNAYEQFKRRHILLSDFNTSRTGPWVDYLTRKNLCGRRLLQSFLHKNNIDRVIRICNGRGVRHRENLCISKHRFTVYIVESSWRNDQCEVVFQTQRSYVIVACEVVENRCLPVHYETQRPRPPQHGQTCRPR